MFRSYLVALLVSFSGVIIHDDIEESIKRLTLRIAKGEAGSSLLLERADLHRRHRSWVLADKDLTRAAECGADQAALHWARSRLFSDQALWGSALTHLNAVLTLSPSSSEAYLLRAGIYAQRGAIRQAANDYGAAIATAKAPDVDAYLARARVLAAGGTEHLDEALLGLDQGLKRLGPVPALLQAAIRIEVRGGRVQDALARIDKAIERSPRKETWLVRRADLLIQIGKTKQAMRAYGRALKEIADLSYRQQATRSMRALKQRIEAQLEQHAKAIG